MALAKSATHSFAPLTIKNVLSARGARHVEKAEEIDRCHRMRFAKHVPGPTMYLTRGSQSSDAEMLASTILDREPLVEKGRAAVGQWAFVVLYDGCAREQGLMGGTTVILIEPDEAALLHSVQRDVVGRMS
jgi:hypothetical protein